MPKAILANGLPTQQGSRQTDTRALAAIHARVSTTDQADKGYSLPTQIDACQAMARQEGYAVPDTHVFVDDYIGGRLRCAQCGRAMTGVMNSSGGREYRRNRLPFQNIRVMHFLFRPRLRHQSDVP